MKRMMMTLVALLTIAVGANAMSYEQAREEALFLTDKMAYELNLTDEQYEAAYEINLDYLMSVTGRSNVFGTYWERRNLDLSYILYSWQWEAFRAATYFYRPLFWEAGYWHFGIYARYPRRDYFYFGRPHFYISYRGGHSWHMNGGRSFYQGRRDHYISHGMTRDNHFGMRNGWDRGDYRGHGGSSTRVTGGNHGRGSFGASNQRNQGGNSRGNGNFGGGNGRSNGNGNGSFGGNGRSNGNGNGSFGSGNGRSNGNGNGHSSGSFGAGSDRSSGSSTHGNGSFGGGSGRSSGSSSHSSGSFGARNNSSLSTRSDFRSSSHTSATSAVRSAGSFTSHSASSSLRSAGSSLGSSPSRSSSSMSGGSFRSAGSSSSGSFRSSGSSRGSSSHASGSSHSKGSFGGHR